MDIENIIIKYLNGSINQSECNQLFSWLKDSDGNRKIFLDYYKIWSLSEAVRFDENKALQIFIEKMEESGFTQPKVNLKARLYKYISIVAASVVLVILTITFLKNNSRDDIVNFAGNAPRANFNEVKTKLVLSDNKTVFLDEQEAKIEYKREAIKVSEDNAISKQESSDFNQLIIPYGKRSVVTFADGTKAWINSGTRLIYPVEFRKDRREVYVDGEIYIEVKEDKSRPFIVKSDRMEVKVLGTKFNISAYESDTQKKVILVSGSVKVLSKDEKRNEMVLKPDQMCLIEEGNMSVESINAGEYIMWIDGFYIFESVNLSEILTRLSRYYNKTIVCGKPAENLKCTGKLDMKDNLKEVLQGLTNTVPISFNQNKDGTYSVDTK